MACLLCAACGDGSVETAGVAETVSVTDSAGIRIVSNHVMDESSADRWMVETTPDVVLGSGSAGDPSIGAVASVALDSAGRIVVADRVAGEIRVFERDGRLSASVGAIGDGSGELTSIWRMRVGDDGRIHVLDTGAARLMVFETGGDVAAEQALPPELLSGPDGTVTQPGNIDLLGVLGDGEMVVSGRPYTHPDASGRAWSFATLFGIRPEGGARVISTIPQMELISESAGAVAVRPHFRAVAAAAVTGGRIVVTAARDYRIDYLDGDGRLVLSVRGDVAEVPVTQAHLDAYRTWLFEQLGELPEATLETYRQAFASTPAARTLPAIRHLVTDAAGCTWVERHPDPRSWVAGADTVPHHWDVFDEGGRRVGWALVPAGVRVRTADATRVIATSAGPAGPRVQVHRLDRTAACRSGTRAQ